MSEPTIYVAMSGGVDSSVAAALLVEQGYRCEGATLKIFDDRSQSTEKSRGFSEPIRDARAICDKLNIPHHTIDVVDFFREKVIAQFVNEYLNGRTPNPCVECNRYVKFGYLMEKLPAVGGDRIATGHYIRVGKRGSRFALRRGVDRAKDQSYFLWRLTQEQLKRALFPLGETSKSETRSLARELGFSVAEKQESQEICFISDNNYAGFVRRKAGNMPKPGRILDMDGNVLGEHKGIAYYTVGQRRGLGLSMPRPVYVARIDAKQNAIIVSENESLFHKCLRAHHVVWSGMDSLHQPINATAQIRYRHQAQPGRLFFYPDSTVEFCFETPQRAITPGQSVVFYDDSGWIIAGGVIESVF
ncbi:MAG: tRNA 2-thiouridine(34) synthase MnmA [Candidatus Cloacimonetes bacterium 4572_55]|nr:MAG: tRNA 2-thiouridine(34) synthase MnmA [Candidatus Cloacimonetes bacterium 4572_55]